MEKIWSRKFETAVGYCLASSGLLAFYTLFVKLGLQGISVWTITFLRFFLPFLLLLSWFLWKKDVPPLWPRRNLSLLIYRSLVVVIGQFSLIYYLTKATLVDANMLWGTGPLFIPILARILHKHKITHRSMWALIISFVGIILVLKPDRGIFDPYSIFGLIAGLSMAVSQTLYGINIERARPQENLFYFFFFCSILSFPAQLIAGIGSIAFTLDFFSLLMIIGFTLSSLWNQIFRGFAYQLARPSALTPFLYFSVLISVLFDALFFHKSPDSFGWTGIALVFAGSLIKWREEKRLTV